MSDQKSIKSFTPWKCPHCDKDIIVIHTFYQPTTDSIIKAEEVAKAKEELLKRLDEVEFKNSAEKEMAVNWVKGDNTIFSLADVEQLAKTIQMSQLAKEEKKKK